LFGARRVDKTTLLQELRSVISKTEKTLYLDFDIFENLEKTERLSDFMQFLALNCYQEKSSKRLFAVY